MKNYTTDMMKLIVLLIVTPLMVMAYTKIEKTVSPVTIETNVEGLKEATPASIGLVGTEVMTDSKAPIHNEYIIVSSSTGTQRPSLIGNGSFKNGFPSSRFAVVLL